MHYKNTFYSLMQLYTQQFDSQVSPSSASVSRTHCGVCATDLTVLLVKATMMQTPISTIHQQLLDRQRHPLYTLNTLPIIAGASAAAATAGSLGCGGPAAMSAPRRENCLLFRSHLHSSAFFSFQFPAASFVRVYFLFV